MLDAHEFAMLMLMQDAADQIAERKELDALLERQLAAMERLAGGAQTLLIAEDGDLPSREFRRIH